jgi:hypothetical protein
MLKADASIIGLVNKDELDAARRAKVSASSVLTAVAVENGAERIRLTQGMGLLLPIGKEGISDGIELLVDADETTVLEAALYLTGKPENYVPAVQQCMVKVHAEKGEKRWVKVPFRYTPDQACNVFVTFAANPHASVYVSPEPLTGVLAFMNNAKPEEDEKLEAKSVSQPVVQWSMRKLVRKPICFRLSGTASVYEAANVIDGYNRPYGGPHMWISEPMRAGQEEFVELSWEETVNAGCIQITFNDDLNEDLINLHHHSTPFEVIPELVKAYRVEGWLDGTWSMLLRETDNRKRKREHTLDRNTPIRKLRLVIEETNGSPRAEVVEIRVYESV